MPRNFQHSLLPEGLKENEFFQANICPISLNPIVHPLFISVHGKVAHMYEKKALVQLIFDCKQRNRPLQDPVTGEYFTEKDLYHCPDLTAQFLEKFLQVLQSRHNIPG